ncbi:MAG: 3' terminal RNA ribose 2'-O-methyltransferase Hen1, partial [Clostridia bacterium]|nr:3' terminal RNA ribose 2'-O-methyltransferase Hen1 [Clostridia bacterium]
MLLTITYKGKNTQDLGYLLHKNPQRAQRFGLSFGNAYVFYTEVSNEKTTAALLLDINPIDLARGKLGAHDGGLFDYVNDRPYVASSFMSTALSKVFGTAMSGKCEHDQKLAETPLDLTACVYMLPCRGKDDLPNALFEPLGYKVKTKRYALDEKFPEWGESAYIDLTLKGKVTLSALLNHLYVLIPTF